MKRTSSLGPGRAEGRPTGVLVGARLPHHVEPPVLVQEEVLEHHWSDEDLDLALDNQVVDHGVHEGEPLTGEVVSVLHGNEDVAARSENSHQLRQGGGIDLTGSESVGGHDDVVRLVVDRDGAEPLHPAVDVVLEDPLSPGPAQHAQGGVQPVNVAVAVPPNLSPEQSSPGRQVQHAHLVAQAELHQGLRTLDVAVVVAHHHQVVVVLLRPVVVELGRGLRVRVVHQHGLDLSLELHWGRAVQVVGETAGQSLHHVQLTPGASPLVGEELVPDHRALPGLDQPSQVLLEQPELRGVFRLCRLHAPDHETLGPEDSQGLHRTLEIILGRITT